MRKRAETERAKRHRRSVSGSLTVEAALVMLLVLAAVFSMLQLTLWLKERTEITARLVESLYALPEEAEALLQEKMADLAFARAESCDYTAEGKKRLALSQGAGAYFWPGAMLSFDEQQQRTCTEPVRFLRLCRAAQSFTDWRAEGSSGE